ncbi:MAG: hypothetical protein A2V67_04460 [Deltaproteobacteria bacterium RBG_13_61_14]|nr:MAG: hypothetical protein A2V67_04460 [Deltaproteobacteria bacterium RBG_13_61_14]
MKIALVNPILRSEIGGKVPRIISNREAMIVQTGRAMAEMGHQVRVFASLSYRPEQADEAVPVTYLPDRYPGWFAPEKIPWLKGLARELAGDGFDAVLASETFQVSSLTCAWAKTKVKRPLRLIIWQEMGLHPKPYHTLASRLYYQTLARWLMQAADRFIPRCQRAAAFLLENGLPPAKLGPIIPHGVNEEVFHPAARPEKDPGLILCVSRLVETKGLETLIQAFAQIRPDFPELRLLIKGSGPLEASLRGLASRLGARDRVVLDTRRSGHSEMADLYRRALFLAAPSKVDLLHFAPLEAMACGTPVIVSTGTYHGQELADGKGGLTFPAGDVPALAAAMRSLLQCSERREELAAQARERARAFSNRQVAQALLQELSA